jgi:hypothetical protein
MRLSGCCAASSAQAPVTPVIFQRSFHRTSHAAAHHASSNRNLPNQLQLSAGRGTGGGLKMNQLIYLIGLIVVILAILSFFGLR